MFLRTAETHTDSLPKKLLQEIVQAKNADFSRGAK